MGRRFESGLRHHFFFEPLHIRCFHEECRHGRTRHVSFWPPCFSGVWFGPKVLGSRPACRFGPLLKVPWNVAAATRAPKPQVDSEVFALILVTLPAESKSGMNRGIYAATAGMGMLQRQLDVVANNLANVSTNGFKKDSLSFNDVLGKSVKSAGGTIGSFSYGPSTAVQVTAFEETGQIMPTGNPLDMAIDQPKGAFAIRSVRDGQVYYTRDGAFTRSMDGKLATRSGDLVLDDRLNEIPLGDGTPKIDGQGRVLVDSQEVGQIAVFDGTFQKDGLNRWRGTATLMEEPALRPKALETSNVNSIEAMVEMIELQRAFDIAQRSITTQDELSQRLINSLLNG